MVESIECLDPGESGRYALSRRGGVVVWLGMIYCFAKEFGIITLIILTGRLVLDRDGLIFLGRETDAVSRFKKKE